MSRLQQIQVTTQQMAEAISSVLGMDVSIVDETMLRIAGTGQHKQGIGRKIISTPVFHKVIKNAQEHMITDVSTHDDCSICEQRTTCMELAQLCCPIILGKEVIGFIGLIAFSKEQQLEIKTNGQRLLVFIRKMAEMISAKAAERSSLERLKFFKNQIETVLNFVAEGILAIDDEAKIININFAATKMLNVKAADVIGFNLNEVFPATPIPDVLRSGVGFINRECSLWHKGKHHHYLINAKPMLVDDIVQGVVASFSLVGNYGEEGGLSYKKQQPVTFDQILGSSDALEAVKEEARKGASGHSTILIMGESGTGKELFARAIHFGGERWQEPFIAINCAAIPETLLESEMFGYEEGSFSGAKKGGKPGKFQLAHRGTLFLDEIGDMPLALQAKMLRVLQEKVVEKVGSVHATSVDVRVIGATNRDLEDMVRQGLFRQDLYYRLNVFQVILPPLRTRPEDIRVLAEYFLRKHAALYRKSNLSLSKEAIAVLQQYQWPGNIRELENTMECAVIKMTGHEVTVNDLPIKIGAAAGGKPITTIVTHSEKAAIQNALQTYGSHVEGKQQAAASLGIGIATLYRKIRKYDL